MSEAKTLPEGTEPLAAPERQKPPAVALAFDSKGVLDMEPSGDWTAIVAAAGSPELVSHIVSPVGILGAKGQRTSERASNTVLGFVSAMKPQDPAELLLLTQMGTIHLSTMMLARRLNHVETLPQQDAAERALNKLARTFAGQMETLKRYRSKDSRPCEWSGSPLKVAARPSSVTSRPGGGAPMKDDGNPMNPAWGAALKAANAAPRCTARSKRTRQPCQAPAVTSWRVCRFHGAGGGHAAGPSHPSWRHGMRSREWVEERRHFNDLVREAREIEALIG